MLRPGDRGPRRALPPAAPSATSASRGRRSHGRVAVCRMALMPCGSHGGRIARRRPSPLQRPPSCDRAAVVRSGRRRAVGPPIACRDGARAVRVPSPYESHVAKRPCASRPCARRPPPLAEPHVRTTLSFCKKFPFGTRFFSHCRMQYSKRNSRPGVLRKSMQNEVRLGAYRGRNLRPNENSLQKVGFSGFGKAGL